MKAERNIRAFSLVEMAVVMVIAGLLLAGVTGAFANYMQERRVRVTHERLDKFAKAMQTFYEQQGRYPCPADPTTPEDGTEKCGADAFQVVGGMDTTYLGTGEGDPVYIGAIPYETLRIGMEDTNPDDGILESDPEEYRPSHEVLTRQEAADDWGRFFTYMVPEALTARESFNAKYASIQVVTENWVSNVATPEEVLARPAAAWVAFSHGRNGAGGRNADGGALSPIPCEGKEADNCTALETDATPLDIGQAVIVSGLHNSIKGPNYFDDIVYFASVQTLGFWADARNDPANAGSLATRDIANTNLGFVGIGERNPAVRLDVKGGVQATRVRATEICTSDGQNCIDPANLSGVQVCPAGQAMTGIAGGVVQCGADPVQNIAPVYGSSCALGTYVLGIDNAGNMICGMP